jgi:hypothetical protein
MKWISWIAAALTAGGMALASGTVESRASALGSLSGVNLPKLEDNARFTEFVASPRFGSNLRAMGWNTFRLPIEWQDYTSPRNGRAEDDELKIRAGLLNLEMLLARLKGIHAPGTKTFLIIDFHQFKFGPLCGGVGIPRGMIPEQGLKAEDPNCIMLAFDRFWENQNGARDRWIRFSMRFIQALPRIARDHEDWLTLGIEPINEPQFGMKKPFLFPSLAETVWALRDFLVGDGVTPLINRQLIPFYKSFLDSFARLPDADVLASKALLVFEPFLVDYLTVGPSVLGHAIGGINLDGDYSGMKKLARLPGRNIALRWVAGPHHYFGAMDDGFLPFLPKSVGEMLVRYPNLIFSRLQIDQRMERMARRMREAGMEDTFIGEWGTQTGLMDMAGGAGGYLAWIRDSKDAMSKHTAGGIWWSCDFDRSDDQSKYYLLRTRDERGWPIAPFLQRLKCGPKFSLARDVFGTCPRD